MSPLTHFFGSWLVAAATTNNPRDRKLVTLAGILPDLDGLGMVADFAQGAMSGQPTHYEWYQRYHHVLLHGWPGAIVVAGLLALFGRQKFRVLLLCLLTFHLHLAGDLIGSRGPAPTDLWPICYSEPVFRNPVWFWQDQWRLDGWQNQIICILVFGAALWVTIRRGHSFLEVFNRKLDAVFVGVLQKWRARLKGEEPGG